MATLVMTAMGVAIGGPLGGAIGAVLGNQIDSAILGELSGSRQGPRLNDLAVQTSQYGALVPRIYGRMRVAGTVIWATDLVEHRDRQGGGKGQPSQTTYSYSVSFAVALSSRPIQSIGRIWADGNLLRGVGGDFKTETGFRLYKGLSDQSVDPLIAGIEAGEMSPAYRDYAYCVFEDFDLTEYGNRIPSLTFEVIADQDKLSPITPMQDFPGLAPNNIAQADIITGYAVGADNWRTALAELLNAFPMHADWRSDGLHLSASNAPQDIALNDVPLLALEDQIHEDARTNIVSEKREQLHRQSAAIALRYYEPERDYQAGLRRSAPGLTGSGHQGRIQQIDLPAAMTVTDAQSVVQQLHRDQMTSLSERTIFNATVDPQIRPGAIVRLDDDSGYWRVTSWVLENVAHNGGHGIVCRMNLVRCGSLDNSNISAIHPGRSVQPVDQPASPIDWALLDLPCLPNQIANQRRLFAAAWPEDGNIAGWRHADIYRSAEDGALLLNMGRIRSPAIIGETRSVLPPSCGLVFNRNAFIEVDFGTRDPGLESLDTSGQNAGGNVAMLGEEIIQFCRAEWLGAGRYLLSEIYRALGDGRGAAQAHNAGTRIIILDSSMLALDSQGFAADSVQNYAATSAGNDVPLLRVTTSQARALLPLAPVHLSHAIDFAGNITLFWIRRDRHRPGWVDGPDSLISESRERYQIIITSPDSGNRLVFESEVAELIITAGQIDDLQPDGAGGLIAEIRQIGDYGLSEPAQLSLL